MHCEVRQLAWDGWSMREESAQLLARGQARGQLDLLADDIGEQRG